MNKHLRLLVPLLSVGLLFGTVSCSSEDTTNTSANTNNAPTSGQQSSSTTPTAEPATAENQEKIDLSEYPTDDREALIWTVNKVIEASELDGQNFKDRDADRSLQGDTLTSVVEFGAKEYPNTMSLTHPEVFDHAAAGTENQLRMVSAPFDMAQKFRDTEDTVEITFDPSYINYLTEDRVWLGAGSFKTTINGVEETFTTDPAYDPDFDQRYIFVKDADGKWKISSSMAQIHILEGFWNVT